jgi:hypothetical protein
MFLDPDKIHLAVVTGGHTFAVPPFLQVFAAMPDVEFYHQALDEYANTPDIARQYDAVLFYNHHQNKPGETLPWFQSKFFDTLGKLGDSGAGMNMGIGVLHHAFHAFFDFPLWDDLTGHYQRREVKVPPMQAIGVHIADASHPIARGLSDFSLFDEPYDMPPAFESDGNHIILESQNPANISSMAWTRQFKDSRVFCFQSGHDGRVFGDENYRRVMHNAVRWLAKREG